MAKMVDMSRDPEQLSEMIGNYDPEYPIGFFLDPRMVKDLGLTDAKPGDEINIVGCLRVKNSSENDEGKKELYVSVKELGVTSENKSPTDKMKETYKGADDGANKT